MVDSRSGERSAGAPRHGLARVNQSTGTPVIAFATDNQTSGATSDDAGAASIIADLCQAQVEAVAWDSQTDWSRYAAVLIRSTWDYHLRVGAFLDWAEGVEAAGATLWNPASVVRWNANKRYLLDLERAGVPIVPTAWIHRSAEPDLREVLHRMGWSRGVVKPSVGATAFRTWMVDTATSPSGSAVLSAMLADSEVMVQPFLTEVEREGEWSFMYFSDGEGGLRFSHAVLKVPAAGDFRVQSQFGGTVRVLSPPDELLRQAEEVAAAVARTAPCELLYARIDGVVSAGDHAPPGTLLLMEAELIEPVLFLGWVDGAAHRFAQAVAGRIDAAV
jgi:glutathione synthase/RimK-type ligase-like ATP-grasp enzyme